MGVCSGRSAKSLVRRPPAAREVMSTRAPLIEVALMQSINLRNAMRRLLTLAQ